MYENILDIGRAAVQIKEEVGVADISIIVPVYNTRNYLSECIESILAQSFSDFELILVDDESKDGSSVLCDEYVQKDSRIKVIHQKNTGAASARNTGVALAQGNYICFVDSDDMISPDYCKTLYDLLDGTTYDFSVCGSNRFQDNNIVALYNGVSGVMSNAEYLYAQLQKKSEFGFWNKMFRRNLFNELHFVAGRRNEDVIFSCDIAQKLHNGIVCTDEMLYFYRMNDEGVTARQNKKADPDMIYAGAYLVNTAKKIYPEIVDECLRYAVSYPWTFLDKVYVKRAFKENKKYLNDLQALLRTYQQEYSQLTYFDDKTRNRMMLFARSKLLYAVNAYARLIRLYLFRLLRKDPYADGHGI